jgi:diguanylate cyclase (GGDEF)-like protein
MAAEPSGGDRVASGPPRSTSYEGDENPLRAEDLAEQRLLAGVDLGPVMYLFERCRRRTLLSSEVLISPGSTETTTYLILEGTFDVLLQVTDTLSVATLRAGDSVGEISLIDGQPRSAAVVAKERSRVLEVPAEIFWALMRTSHQATLNLIGVLAERLRGNNDTLSESLRLQREFQRHASLDALTGLNNRRWLDEMVPRQLKRSRFQQRPLTLIMLDVDHFKRFNDDHGHQAGDFVLFAVAQILRSRLRPTDLLGRYGGEEFTIVLPDTNAIGAVIAAERVRRSVEETELVLPDGRPLPRVTVSLGIAAADSDTTVSQLFERADRALYRAKQNGRNRVEVSEADEPVSGS